MKNIQVIDGAMNSTYSFFQCDDQQFRIIFPMDGQNILFIEDVDFLDCFSDIEKTKNSIRSLWSRPIRHEDVKGVHGTIFYGKNNCKKYYPESRKWSDMDPSSLNKHQRKMYSTI